MPMLPEEKARVKIDKQLRNAGWDIVARNEYLPNSIDGTAIRIQFKISGLSKIKDILTEINEEGKPTSWTLSLILQVLSERTFRH